MMTRLYFEIIIPDIHMHKYNMTYDRLVRGEQPKKIKTGVCMALLTTIYINLLYMR